KLVDSCKKVESAKPSASGPGQIDVPAEDAPYAFSCLSFISGVLDAEAYYAHAFHAKIPECIPSTATDTQLARVIVKYGNDHPEKLHLAAVDMLSAALVSAFP